MKKIDKSIILAIETSCDDTGVAVLLGRRVLSSVVASQVELHKKWGGVVPDIARRAHQENIGKVYKEALKRARIEESDIDYVAVTYGPGLAIALEVGIEFARDLAYKNKIKLVPINHMEGHMLAPFLLNKNNNGVLGDFKKGDIFPFMALLISGSHTEIVHARDFHDYEILGETMDDAAGEAFDKVARMMNVGYPGGAILTSFADKANKDSLDAELGFEARNGKKPIAEIAGKFGLTIPMMRSGDLNFSFSGLKTACLYKIKELRQEYKKDTEWTYDLSREFINAITKSLKFKFRKALLKHPEVKTVMLGGGVSNNKYIIREIGNLARKMDKKFLVPEIRFRCDNAGMIGIAAYYNIKNRGDKACLLGKKILKLDREPTLSL